MLNLDQIRSNEAPVNLQSFLLKLNQLSTIQKSLNLNSSAQICSALFHIAECETPWLSSKCSHTTHTGFKRSAVGCNHRPCRPVYPPGPQWSSWRVWRRSEVAWWPPWCSSGHLATSPSGLGWNCKAEEKNEKGIVTQVVCKSYNWTGGSRVARGDSYLAPVVHETLEVLEEHVLVFVQDPFDRISATHAEGRKWAQQTEWLAASGGGQEGGQHVTQAAAVKGGRYRSALMDSNLCPQWLTALRLSD